MLSFKFHKCPSVANEAAHSFFDVAPTEHGFEYRAVYSLNGVRVVGFDNERGKGDHCHLDGKEVPYTFVSIDQLVEDFIAAVASRRAP